MFDTMTLTKTAGALFGALLVFMLGGWVAQEIYAPKGHGGDGHGQAYVIEVDEADGAAEEEEAVDFAALYMAADPAKGERVFSKCSACHKLEAGQNAVGPYLYGVVGREVDAAEGFGYSGALSEVVDVWTPEELYAFLENPRAYAAGTSMGFAGLKKSEDRVNVIAYMDMVDGEMTPVEAAGGDDQAATEAEPETDTAAVENEEAATEEAATEEAATEEAATEEAATEEATDEAEMASETPAEDATAETDTTETAAEDEAEETASSDGDASDGDASGFAALVAAADVSAGAKVFNQCKACHVLEAGTNRVGPYLHGVVGRAQASAEGFKYSNAFQSLEGTWTYDELSAFLENPRDYAKGNRMSFRGLSDEADRAAVIAYIEAESQ